MKYSFEAIPKDDPLIKSTFHHFLVAFAAPARWPVGLIYLLGGIVSAGLAWLWAIRSDTPGGWLMFAFMVSFFIADKLLLAGLPVRQISFAPWTSQIMALGVCRSVGALVLGLIAPYIGWWAAFTINAALQALGSIALYRGAIIEPGRLAMTALAVSTDRLPANSPPLRLLHLSDLHIERLGCREAQLLALIHQADPDIILITGDYVNLSNNTDPETHAQVRQLLSQLSARGGVFAVLGSPAVDLPGVIPALFEDLPVRLLRNEGVELHGASGQRVTVVGIDCRHDIAGDTLVLDHALAGVTGTGPRLLLYHSPELMPAAVARDIDLYLCGHTHGGQVRLPGIGALLTSSRLGRRYVMGHYHEGRTHLYVSRGVGFEGLGAPRVRFLCPPEITLVTLSGSGQTIAV